MGVARECGQLAAKIYEESISSSSRSGVPADRRFDERLLENALLDRLENDEQFRQALTGLPESDDRVFCMVTAQLSSDEGRPDLSLSYGSRAGSEKFKIEIKAWSRFTELQQKGGAKYADLTIVPSAVGAKDRPAGLPCMEWADVVLLGEPSWRSVWFEAFVDGVLYGTPDDGQVFECPDLSGLGQLWDYLDQVCDWVSAGSRRSGRFNFSNPDIGYVLGARAFWLNGPTSATTGFWQRLPGDVDWTELPRDHPDVLSLAMPSLAGFRLLRVLFMSTRAAYLRLPTTGLGVSVAAKEGAHWRLGRQFGGSEAPEFTGFDATGSDENWSPVWVRNHRLTWNDLGIEVVAGRMVDAAKLHRAVAGRARA